MLLARMLGWITAHKTTHIFILEVLAVFIGITGSLLVDNWREERADYEQLDRELRDLHWELQKDVSNQGVANPLLIQATASARLLGFGDTNSLSDAELLEHYWRATLQPWNLGRPPALQSTNDQLSIPYNDVLALIESELQNVHGSYAAYDGVRAYTDEQVLFIIEKSGIIGDSRGTMSLVGEDLVQLALDMDAVTVDVGNEYVADTHNLARVRAAIDDPEIRARFQRLVFLHKAVGKALLVIIMHERSTIAAIRRHAPDITIPFAEVGVDGSGTQYGWQTYLPMTQDASDPAIWRTTLDLVTGEVKFRADNAWAVNWGTSEIDISFECDTTYTDEEDCGSWGFRGDLSKAFPTGSAQLEGSNIPVKAGRYHITFNTETLEYSFELVEESN